jgi:hypothetical protein
MLLSALLLVPSLASALSDAGYGTLSKRSHSIITPELSDLRGLGGISYAHAVTNDSLVCRTTPLFRS